MIQMETLETILSISVVLFCGIMLMSHEPYFDSWKECRKQSGDTDSFAYHPYIDGECCEYTLIGETIECRTTKIP